MESFNNINGDLLRIEVATLINGVSLKSPAIGKFVINSITQNYSNGSISSNNKNIYNKKIMPTKLKNTGSIEIPIPVYMRIFFNESSIIPAGTKFVVGFISADINKPVILSLYSMESLSNTYSYYELQEEVKKLKKRVKKLEKIAENHETRITALESRG